MKRILLIDDDSIFPEILIDNCPEFEIHWAISSNQAKHLLRIHEFDIVISDYLGVDAFSSEPNLAYLPKDKTIVTSSTVIPQNIEFEFVIKDDLVKHLKSKLGKK